MRSSGFRYDWALRCGDGSSQCPAQYLDHIVLDGCSSQNALFRADGRKRLCGWLSVLDAASCI